MKHDYTLLEWVDDTGQPQQMRMYHDETWGNDTAWIEYIEAYRKRNTFEGEKIENPLYIKGAR